MGGKRGTSGIGKSETVSRVNPSSKTMSGTRKKSMAVKAQKIADYLKKCGGLALEEIRDANYGRAYPTIEESRLVVEVICEVSAKSGMDWDLWHAVRQRIQP
jgi:hypothetical protein